MKLKSRWGTACLSVCLSFMLCAMEAQGQPAPSSETMLAAKAHQKREYDKCRKSYEFWNSECERLAKYPDKSSDLTEAKTKADKLLAEAKTLVSPEYLERLVTQYSKNNDAAQKREQDRLAKIAAEEAKIAAEEAAIVAAKEEAERVRVEQIARQRAARAAEEARLLAAQKAQEARDRETWGILTQEKYDRLDVGMSVWQVEKIVGPGKNLGSKTVKVFDSQIDITDYRWEDKAGMGVMEIRFDEDGLYKKEIAWR